MTMLVLTVTTNFVALSALVVNLLERLFFGGKLAIALGSRNVGTPETGFLAKTRFLDLPPLTRRTKKATLVMFQTKEKFP